MLRAQGTLRVRLEVLFQSSSSPKCSSNGLSMDCYRMAPKCSSSGSVRMILRHKMVGIGSGRAAGVSCTEVFGGTGCTLFA